MPNLNNKRLGNAFEVQFCDALAKHHFWVHFMSQTQAGQPADVIAVKNKKAFLIDCKVCTHNYFLISRIEFNQELAMNLWEHTCGNGTGWLALKMQEQIYMLAFSKIDLATTRIGLKQIQQNAMLLKEWVNYASTN